VAQQKRYRCIYNSIRNELEASFLGEGRAGKRGCVGQADRGRLSAVLDKPLLIKKIIAELGAELEACDRSARAAHAEATDEQSKAENKYDTRGLEASYLARGQSRQAAEIVEAIQEMDRLPVRNFGAGEPIELGAVVELEGKRERTLFFIGPRGGGKEIALEGQTVLVITPQSPLGQQLAGKRQGEQLVMTIGGTRERYRVAAVE
jgi:transcription elongation GreA/GreB family factor